MNKSLLIGLIAGAGAATAVGAVANYARDRALDEPAARMAPLADSRGEVVRDPVPVALPADPTGASTADEPERAFDVVDEAPERASRVADEAPAPARVAPRRAVDDEPVQVMPVRARFAEVVDVQPVTKTVQESREVCTDVPVQRQAPVKDEHRVVGTLAGAVIGGLLGNQVGGGDGRKIATVAGAAAGGYAGNRVQDRIQKSNTISETERQCQTISEPREQTIGYDVTYSYEGRTHTVRMNHEPGRRLPARDGRVILTANAG